MEFYAFLHYLVPEAVYVENADEAKGKTVPKVLLERVSDVLRLQERAREEDFMIQEIFQKYFLSAYGLNARTLDKISTEGMQMFKVPCDRMRFHTSAFARVLSSRMRSLKKSSVDIEVLGRMASDYNIDNVRDCLRMLKQRHAQQVQQLLAARREAMQESRNCLDTRLSRFKKKWQATCSGGEGGEG
ncbi:hypothetical protein Efla_007813 [Eimeria flavescens]